ncbi:hypothetical protein [Maricaulis sp.]|uniref:hypothetical protein n=1 Tax=Maricaulis sp. TaxID=1486257 RepID=UPI003A8DB837
MIRTLIFAVGGALILQGGAVAQSRGDISGYLPAIPNVLDIRSDSRRTVRHLSQDQAGKGEGDLAGAPRQVETQPAGSERTTAPLAAVQPADEKGRATANLVMTGGGAGAAATQYSFHLEDVKPN